VISTQPSRVKTLSALIIGTFAVSTAAPFIKLAGMHPLALTAGRLLGVALVYAIVGRDFISQWRQLSRRNKHRLAFGSSLLTGHFVCWISAFELTDLPSAVLLLVLQPLFASVFGARLFRERITRGVIGSLVVAIIGLAIITYDDLQLSHRHLMGDGLVALGAFFIIGFLSVGKNLRPKLSFSAFMTLAYGGAGLWAVPLVILFRVPLTDYPAASYGWLLGIIFITTGIGHAALNYVLPYVRLYTVNLSTVAEPIIAIVAAIWFMDETVTIAEVIGGGFLTAALLFGLRDEWQPREDLTHLEPG
jgi:drug/metabolite transporter (DMT)-like permease